MHSRWQRFLFFLRIQWPLILAGLAVVLAFYWTFQLVEEPPPKEITLAAGSKNGGYFYFAQEYAKALEKRGIRVTILETKGSLENLQLLHGGDSRVSMAFAQAGVGWMSGAYSYAPEESSIRSLGRIYEEPLWIFTRKQKGFELLRELKGRRLAVGIEGSGTRALALDLLKWNGILPEDKCHAGFGGRGCVSGSEARGGGCGFFVGGTGSPFLRRCMADPELLLHSFEDAEAYERRFPFLQEVRLARGVLDLGKSIPPREVRLLAPSATLVASEDLHEAIVYLFYKRRGSCMGGTTFSRMPGFFLRLSGSSFLCMRKQRVITNMEPPFTTLPALSCGGFHGSHQDPVAASVDPAAAIFQDCLPDLSLVDSA
ncbi:MAG: hypothetical protein HC904_03610 [Blastochloris sp.]|nr:hypothetical protein [Blastochloris sp.]